MKLSPALYLAALLATPVYAAETRIIDVELGSYFFKPEKISVKVGEPVTLKLTNSASVVPHDLKIVAPEAGIDVKVDVAAGKTASVSFTPTKAGTYEMVCDKKLLFFTSHKDKGMHGVLEVTQ